MDLPAKKGTIMQKRKIRIGIDVGGTFTHAVALDHQSYQVIAHAVTPTTHSSQYSVSEGIIKTFQDVLQQTGAAPEDVVFVAHSTTQATNALLEGDVAKVGIIGMGRGVEALKAKADTAIADIPLSENKALHTACAFLSTDPKDFTDEDICRTVEALRSQGCRVIVASEAFGVDDPRREDAVTGAAQRLGLPATASHEISQLYGLKVRTRTAVINASILPKMTQTADMTNESIQSSGITAPLMIMRSDGGVMDIGQMRKRPILTLLSGPAAGIAAALMYANVSDGIFLEVGGTSTDISVIHNGKAMVKSANVGGHSTFLKTLDSRTVGIGGGSMVRLDEDGRIRDVGPRSAHIAGLEYLAFASSEELKGAKPSLISPMEGDAPDHLVMENPAGKRFAVTLTDAAIMAGMVREGDYAFGNLENVQQCFSLLGQQYGQEPKAFAEAILDKAVQRVDETVQTMLQDYQLDPQLLSLVGGGGGCTAVVPWLSRKNGIRYMIAEKAEVISAIGAAMAMLRDTVARTVIDPSPEDIAAIRRQAMDSLIAMGAAPGSIEVQMEIDRQKNIVSATATGSLQMEQQELGLGKATPEELERVACESLKAEPVQIKLAGQTEGLYIFSAVRTSKKLFGLLRSEKYDFRVLDSRGVVKLQINDGQLLRTCAGRFASDMDAFLQNVSSYNDAGQILPEVFVLHGSRIADLSSVLVHDQVMQLAGLELEGASPDMPVCVLVHPRK